MSKLLPAIVVVLLTAVSSSAQTVSADRFTLNTGPCVERSGSGSPSGGATCDRYVDTATGDFWTNKASVWTKVVFYDATCAGCPEVENFWASRISVGSSVAGSHVGLFVQSTDLVGTTQYGIASNPHYAEPVTDGIGIATLDYVDDGVSLTNRYGVMVHNPVESGSGTVTNNYGIYVQSQTAGSTANTGLYIAQVGGRAITQASSTATNYFDGPILLNNTLRTGGTSNVNYIGAYVSNVFAPAVSNTTQYGLAVDPTYGTAATIANAVSILDRTQTGVALGTRRGLFIQNPSLVAGGTITNNYGLVIDNQTSGSASDTAIYIAQDSGFAINQPGAGSNVFNGTTLFGNTIRTADYASQTTGWAITEPGAGDFRYLFTDELHAKIFSADLEQVLAGRLAVAKSYGTLSRDFTCPSATLTATLYVDDFPSAEDMAVFEAGDAVVVHNFSRAAGSLTIGECTGTVATYTNLAGTEQSWVFTRNAVPYNGTISGGTVISAESVAIDYGTTGNGYYEVNAIDGAYAVNSPYSQVVTWTTAPVAAQRTVRTRTGNLLGVTGTAEYGFFGGTFGTGTSGQYFLASDQNVELHGVNFSMYDGSDEVLAIDRTAPSFAMGKPSVPTAYGTGVGLWMGKDVDTYWKFRIGDPSGGRLAWDGTALTAAGWTLTASSLTSNNIALYSGAASTARIEVGASTYIAGLNSAASSSEVAIWAGQVHSSRGSAPFRVTAAGALTTTSGQVGGWYITSSTLYNDTYESGQAPIDYPFYAGATYANRANAEFKVTAAGALTATNATITGAITATSGTFSGTVNASAGWFGNTTTGWNIGASYLYNNTYTAGMAPADYPFYAGDTYANRANAEFKVTSGGALTASNATLTGTLSAASNNVNINASGIVLQAGGSYFLQWTNGAQMGSNGTELYLDTPTSGSFFLSAGAEDYRWNVNEFYPYTTGATDLGRSANYWERLYVEDIFLGSPPTTINAEYPIVRYSGDGQLYEKTDGQNDTTTCGSGVYTVSGERGILTGSTCLSPEQIEAGPVGDLVRQSETALRQEVETLREQNAWLLQRMTELENLVYATLADVTIDGGTAVGGVGTIGGWRIGSAPFQVKSAVAPPVCVAANGTLYTCGGAK